MKLRELQDRMWTRFGPGMTKLQTWEEFRAYLDKIVEGNVEGMGFHINTAGDICDPRPAPAPRDTGLHHRGQPSRARRRK